ncbi:MAG: hypothetical protein HN742_38210 [Lentisphaerae bacterium]|nr:hypothetical protein [Lentisphaerota bacterium]MBT4820197.1 hypothetical protein [Lentisphaerota bacterium]MBT5608425.1 hypothetical protein [Lentisphaerota bacterium]MBT7055043.1 hypothetical protein [Lentisphaerota bacterium]MBT7847763.1 hypothetical protein [Lentisphaerota bacterium]
MGRIRRSWPVIVALAILAMAGCNIVPRSTWAPVVTGPTHYFEYGESHGYFVSVPAYVGFAAGLPVGAATAPAGLVMESHDGMRKYVVLTFACLGPTLVGDVVATPFIVIKSLLWDLPFASSVQAETAVPLDDLLSF